MADIDQIVKDMIDAALAPVIAENSDQDAAIAEMEADAVALEARVAALEGGEVTPPQPPVVLPTLSVADVNIGEKGGNAVFTVTLSKAATDQVTVNYQTISRSAQAGQDFTAVAGNLVFAPGETSKTVNVAILDDAVVEAIETFDFTLTAAVGATLLKATGLGTITSDDVAPPNGTFWQGLATKWPTPETVGPAAGTVFTTEGGGSKSGTHKAKKFTGSISPQAGSVFEDCEIAGMVDGDGKKFRMTRCRIRGGSNPWSILGCVTLENSEIIGGEDAIKTQGDGWSIKYNYISGPHTTSTSHNDGVQMQWKNTNGLCEGNVIKWTDTSEFFTQIQSGEPITGIVCRWNWFGGSDLPVRIETGCSASVYENAIKKGNWGYADMSGTLVRKDGNIDAISGAVLKL